MEDKKMSYDELLRELKLMQKQINHYRRLTKEMHRLDAEWWHIQRMDKKGALPDIDISEIVSEKQKKT